MAHKLALQSVRIKNFKAIRDSGVVKFTPLTVFIGNNGSGKSSLIEGLELFKSITTDGLGPAMERWRGFEDIWNKHVPHSPKEAEDGRLYRTNPLELDITGNAGGETGWFHAETQITQEPNGRLRFLKERYKVRSAVEQVRKLVGPITQEVGRSLVPPTLFRDWQFVRLDSDVMTRPAAIPLIAGDVKLLPNGANLAAYLWEIFDQHPTVFSGILDAVRYVLPYAKDITPEASAGFGREVTLRLTEGSIALPGWVLSSGTVRILALFSLLRHPKPPAVLFIEEIENGLDPRTLHALVEELRDVTQLGQTQVVLTTHSPYLLDLLPLDSIIVVERDGNNAPVFTRPSNGKNMREWAERFSPGRLYTMGQLSSQRNRRVTP